MRTTMKQWLPAILGFAFILQSCVKNQPIINNPFGEDKLLLSKVTGTNVPIAWNFFEFTRDSVNKTVWDYSAIYSYGSGRQIWGDYKPMQQVSFVNGGSYTLPAPPGGSWDITYKNSLPDEIIDHSIPGVDQGYWKLYYNEKGQVIKTGFAFSTSAGPTEFEFYGYDDHNNLTDLVYGKYVDTPFYKMTYSYDNEGNLTQWQMLFPNGYTNSSSAAATDFYSAVSGLPKASGSTQRPIAEALKKFAERRSNGKQDLSINNYQLKIPPTKLLGDSNVVYELFLTANITNDGKINPFHEEGRLLFFISSRNYTIDLNAYFLQLEKSNPTYIEYSYPPDFGPFRPRISNYTYTYNKLGYPVTSHEATTDPDDVWFPVDYTQDRQIEYIKNN